MQSEITDVNELSNLSNQLKTITVYYLLLFTNYLQIRNY